ncbi:hypothetical protein DSM112329_03021 [Paraconexibacter sp. AEG42_29]|uniref:Glycosyltransferase 2-like domain-containing protein n=1 Tax=Paraconexibacter sp. AEG42_29 TaxID=2997339 RepID=A0AAU7AX36_9ACTN
MFDVSVVIPARDAGATLAATLDALDQQTLDRSRFEVIVVDDGSVDDTAAVATRPGVTLVRRPAPSGAGEARNAGVAQAAAELLAFTDADCRPTPSWLAEGLNALDSADLVQGAVAPDPGPEPRPYDRWVSISEDDGTYTTASLFVKRAFFQQVGGFQVPPLHDNGRLAVDAQGKRAPVGEDTWLGWRLRRAGARPAFAPDAMVHHAVLRRGAAEYISEHARRRHAPGFLLAIPELRRASFVWRGLFVNRRSPLVDLAVAGILVAALTRDGRPLTVAAPYGALVARDAARLGPRVTGARVVADAVGFVALMSGNVRYRTLLL